MRKPSLKEASPKRVTKRAPAVRRTEAKPARAPADPPEAPQGEHPAPDVVPTEATARVAEVQRPAPPEPPELPSPGPELVLIGGVEGRLAKVPMGLVQAVIGQDLMKNAAGLRTPAVTDLMKAMQATDARCAPVYFTHDGDDDHLPALFAGLESIAAAIQLGLTEMFVITVPSANARELQIALIHARNSRSIARTSDEDSLLFQVHAYYGTGSK